MKKVGLVGPTILPSSPNVWVPQRFIFKRFKINRIVIFVSISVRPIAIASTSQHWRRVRSMGATLRFALDGFIIVPLELFNNTIGTKYFANGGRTVFKRFGARHFVQQCWHKTCKFIITCCFLIPRYQWFYT